MHKYKSIVYYLSTVLITLFCINIILYQNCLQELATVGKAVDKFQNGKLSIKKACSEIGHFRLVDINKNSVYTEGNFQSQQILHRTLANKKVHHIYESIVHEMKMLHDIFKSSNSDEVQEEWTSFVKYVDKMVGDSFFKAVKRSLLDINKATRSESHILFSLDLTLQNGRIECKPSMIEITHSLNSISKALIQVISKISRIANSFVLVSSDENISYYDIIASSEEIQTILAQIMNAVIACANGVHREVEYWNKNQALWELDIDAFIRRYEHNKKSLESTLKDITRYNDQMESIDGESNSRRCIFVGIDVSSLKESLIEKCREWKTKLTDLLHNNAKEQLNSCCSQAEKDKDGVIPSGTFSDSSNQQYTYACSETKESIKLTYQALIEMENIVVSSEEHTMLSTLW